MADGLDRRAFLARAGLLGAALTIGLPPLPADAAVTDPPAGLVAWVREQLQKIAAETMSALVAFCVPGADPHSRAQGTPLTQTGGFQAGIPKYTMDVFDRYIAFPDELALPVVTRAAGALGSLPAALPPRFARIGRGDVTRLDKAVKLTLANDESVPASIAIALLLNITATLRVPASLFRFGSFDSAFARLTVAEKALVLADFESDRPTVIGLARTILPADLVADLDGLLKFLTGAVLAIPALGMYSEWPVFDPEARTLRGRPPGWDLTGYLPGRTAPVAGHADLLGYYQGRR